MFILPTGSSKPVCLICSETVAIIKSGNVNRHYETKHKSFEQTYPLKSELRAQKIKDLRAQYDRFTRIQELQRGKAATRQRGLLRKAMRPREFVGLL